MEFPVIDLFAGPGGLGEGFSSFNSGSTRFKVIASAEKDPYAHKTLTLRAYFRYLKNDFPEYLSDYYDFCNGESDKPWTERSRHVWERAESEALLIELGTEEGNNRLHQEIDKKLGEIWPEQPVVLIGGPPCQAYSLAGRAKNMNDSKYDPSKDHRNFLYKEYLKVLAAYEPAVFVMENVKGILSSKINNQYIFHQILQDLAHPSKALQNKKHGKRYVICSMVKDVKFKDGDDPRELDSRSFIIKSEDYGIPQSRHRVILLGIREDFFSGQVPTLNSSERITVKQVLANLPAIRSRFSKMEDSAEKWAEALSVSVAKLSRDFESRNSKALLPLIEKLNYVISTFMKRRLDTGSIRFSKIRQIQKDSVPHQLRTWYCDEDLKVTLNHEARGHILKDIIRYCYAASFAEVYGRSPRGHVEYDHPDLAPSHKNWKSGKFVDRFKVQESEKPASTITSHISKDGHYFIHYDPSQARSLTVREAARIQTFPDNYFFQGPRTQQYHQVGNAVPPLLSTKIAELVHKVLIS